MKPTLTQRRQRRRSARATSWCAACDAACCCRAPKRACPPARSIAPMSTSSWARADAGAAALSRALPRARAHAGLVLDLAQLLQPLPHHGGGAFPHPFVHLPGCADPQSALSAACPHHLHGLLAAVVA